MKKRLTIVVVSILLLVALAIFPGLVLGIGLAVLVVATVLYVGYLGKQDAGPYENTDYVWLYKSDAAENEDGEWN